MMKAHCDNCDALIEDVNPARQVTVQPWGYQCLVTIGIEKYNGFAQVLCTRCLRAAVLAFADSITVTRDV